MHFNDALLKRYARHLILDEIGEAGQIKLLNAKVLVVGAGGLGSPLLMYLAAVGVGVIGIIDNDVVDITNLQRQIIHTTDRVGENKVESAIDTLAGINPTIRVIPHIMRVNAANVMELLDEYDLVADGCDNFPTRYLINDACFLSRKTLVAGALMRLEGQLSTFKAYDGAGPCYRCLYRTPPPPGLIPRCEEAGLLGSVAGVVGTLQATEVVKEILGLGQSLSGSLLLYDALAASITKIKVNKDPACPLCGANATIKDLSGHH